MIDWKTGDIKFTRCPWECNVATKKCKQKKASAFKYKALVEEVDEEAEEKECEDDEETEDDIYLWVLEHIRKVEKKVKKKTDEEMVPPQFYVYLNVFKKRSCYWPKSWLCTLKVKIISNVSNRTTGSQGLHWRPTEERIHLTNEITTNIPGVFHSQERWKV